ncbi:MAG: hypothetical protein KF856_15785 [Cyclobacteriaceae bacterium]|nr:hypothetical protein [Cyclobacteriaceae bacterium]
MRTVEEYLSISLNMLWHDAYVLMESEKLKLFPIMGNLMLEKGEWKKLSELRTEPITNPYYGDKSQIIDMQRQGFYFGIDGCLLDKEGEPIGTNFNQPILVTRKEYNGFYSKLFPYRLIQVTKDDNGWIHKDRIGAYERLKDFLEFHLKEHFDNDFKSYKSFLLSMQVGAPDLVRDSMDSIKLWIESKIIDPIRMEKPKPYSIAYAVWFVKITGTTKNNDTLFNEFQSLFGSTINSIKTYYQNIIKENDIFHIRHKAEINQAIKLLGQYKNGRAAQDEGRNFIKKLGK